MTVIYGCDSTAPPSTPDAQAIFNNGWRFWAPYLGGPRCYFGSQGGLGDPHRVGWTNGAFGNLAAMGFLLLGPIYVGRTHPYDPPSGFSYEQGTIDGNAADDLMGMAGFDEAQPITLDAEYGDYQSEPQQFFEYVAGFTQTIKAANPDRKIVLYSDTYTLGFFGPDQGIDFKWGAAYGRNSLDRYNPLHRAPPYGMYDPAIPPPWDAWQMAPGASFDVNSAVEESAIWAIYTPPA